MPQHDDTVSMHQMLAYAREAMQLAEGKTIADIESDRTLSLVLIHLIAIFGEAANRVQPATRAMYPDINRRQVISTRNRLIPDTIQ